MNQNPHSHERWLAAADRVSQINSEKDNELMHYASKYYDPVKAHKYYMQHRKLKGRRKASGLSKEGREVWNVTKQNITTEKKSDIEKEREKKAKETAALRKRAKQTRERISHQLKLLNDALTRKAKTERQRASSLKKRNNEFLEGSKKAQIEAIRNQKLPSGLTKEEAAEIKEKRQAKIDDIRQKTNDSKAANTEHAKEKSAKISERTKAEKTKNRESAKAQREKVGNELKAALQSTREKFNAAKKSINDSYEKVYDNEYDKIANEYPNETSKKSSSKSKSKSSSQNSAPVDTSAKKAQLEAERKSRINKAVKNARSKSK